MSVQRSGEVWSGQVRSDVRTGQVSLKVRSEVRSGQRLGQIREDQVE